MTAHLRWVFARRGNRPALCLDRSSGPQRISFGAEDDLAARPWAVVPLGDGPPVTGADRLGDVCDVRPIAEGAAAGRGYALPGDAGTILTPAFAIYASSHGSLTELLDAVTGFEEAFFHGVALSPVALTASSQSVSPRCGFLRDELRVRSSELSPEDLEYWRPGAGATSASSVTCDLRPQLESLGWQTLSSHDAPYAATGELALDEVELRPLSPLHALCLLLDNRRPRRHA